MVRKNNFGKIMIIMSLIMGAISLLFMTLANERERNNASDVTINIATMKLVQLDPPKEGDPIAIVETTLGEIRFVLYPQYSPNAVENFISLAESGFYNDTYVYDSQKGAYSGMGTPKKDGKVEGGLSQSREHIKRELNQDLWPFRGAVCMVNNTFERTLKQRFLGGGTYYCGSRFNILNSVKFTEDFSQQVRESSASPELAEAFISKGGIPNFSQQMTIIGQTYKGFDVVDALASLEGKDSGDIRIPDADVKIISVKIDKYSAEEENPTPVNEK